MLTTIYFPALEKWQEEPFNDIIKAKGSGLIFTIVSRRQCGKSILAELVLIYYALTYAKTTSVIIEPTNAQNRKIFRDIVNMLDGSGVIENANNGLLEITFVNGSMIQCKSAESREGLRGFTVSGILIYDEAAYLKDDLFATTLPFTNVHRAPVLLVSTPLFKTGFFYESYVDKEGKSYNWSTFDTSKYLTAKMLEKYKRMLPTVKFMQDYLGLFTDMQGSVFGDFSKCIGSSIDSDSPIEVMGIDWGTGSGNDYTAVVVLNKNKQMVKLDYFNTLDSTHTIDRIYEIYNKYRPRIVVAEGNSIGSVYKDLLLKKLGKPVKVFTTTNDSKNRIINKLQVDIQNKDILLLNDAELMQQLSCYEQELTSTGKPTFNAAKGYHDDIVMALAIALDSLNKNKINIL